RGLENHNIRMGTKISAFVAVLVALQFIAEPTEAGPLSLKSRKRTLVMHLDIPRGWDGPAYTVWPTYETWSFAKKAVVTKSYLEIRISPVLPTDLDWNLATR